MFYSTFGLGFLQVPQGPRDNFERLTEVMCQLQYLHQKVARLERRQNLGTKWPASIRHLTVMRQGRRARIIERDRGEIRILETRRDELRALLGIENL